ncbi:MAG: hypothetical protein V1820_04860 [archaeon]
MASLSIARSVKERFGNFTLLDYLREHLFSESVHAPLDESAYDLFCKNFNGEDVRRVSTGSHMAFLQWEETFGLGEDILVNLESLLSNGGSDQTVLLPCSRIPFQNWTRPGSIDLSRLEHKGIRLSRYTLRGKSKVTVNRAPKITQNEIDKFLESFRDFQRKRDFFEFIPEDKLALFINAAAQAAAKGKTFNKQCEFFSSELWQHLFSEPAKPLKLRAAEDLELVRENLLESKASRAALEESFSGTYGATNSTYFYYGSCKCGIEFPLRKVDEGGCVSLEGNCLDRNCPHNGKEKFSVPISGIIEGVEAGSLNEGLLITFYNIWALTGVDVLGGFKQTEYLTEFREKLGKFFLKLGEKSRADKIMGRRTDLLSCGLLASFNKDGTPKKGAQLFFEGGIQRNYLEKLASQKFGNLFDASVATMEETEGKKSDSRRNLEILSRNGLSFMVS